MADPLSEAVDVYLDNVCAQSSCRNGCKCGDVRLHCGIPMMEEQEARDIEAKNKRCGLDLLGISIGMC